MFFYLYNRTVRQLKDYHDSLINVQNVFLAMTLVADTSDPDLKADLVAQLLAFLTTKKSAETSHHPAGRTTMKNETDGARRRTNRAGRHK